MLQGEYGMKIDRQKTKRETMDIHTLTKIEARRNTFLVIVVCIIIIFFIGYFLLMSKFIHFDTIVIGIGAVLIVLLMIFGGFATYWTTMINNYSDLYRGNISANSKFKAMLAAVTNDKVIIPLEFFKVDSNLRKIYYDCTYSYFNGFSNASLPTTLRCLEVGLKEKYKSLQANSSNSAKDTNFINEVNATLDKIKKKRRNAKLDDISLYNLIECAKDYYSDQKQTIQYLRSLRNLIHNLKTINDSDAQYAITKITEVINILYELPSILDIKVKCGVCGEPHQYEINTSSFYIGNKLSFECTNRETEREDRRYTITLLPQLTDIF
ncbi:MAG: hypothetical protein QXL94_02635 [Candidatus Parvarchaeum sp.]